MPTSPTDQHPATVAALPIGHPRPTVGEAGQPGAVDTALWQMADTAAHGCAATVRDCCYSADVAVTTVARTVAAAAIITGNLDHYLADVWPGAAPLVIRAHLHLTEARALLDEAGHHCALTRSTLDSDDALQQVLAQAAPHGTTPVHI